MRNRWLVCICTLAGLLCVVPHQADAQEASVGAALRSLAQNASSVFLGQVISIRREPGVVEIEFRVDQVVAGSAVASYTLREWAGLWPPGMQRYHVGDRAMFFAQTTSGAGLSTPVNGAEGVVPIVFGNGSAAPLLDVSRLEARVLRSGTAALGRAPAGVSVNDAMTLVRGARQASWTEPRRWSLPGQNSLPANHSPIRVALPAVDRIADGQPVLTEADGAS